MDPLKTVPSSPCLFEIQETPAAPAQFRSHRRKVAKSIFSHLTDDDKNALLASLDNACKILAKVFSH